MNKKLLPTQQVVTLPRIILDARSISVQQHQENQFSNKQTNIYSTNRNQHSLNLLRKKRMLNSQLLNLNRSHLNMEPINEIRNYFKGNKPFYHYKVE